LFKFIIQSNLANSNDLRNIFNDLKPEISLKSSKNNKYTSISIKVFIDSPEEIVKRYKEVGDKIKGVISL
jgi:putative lipoic acid-binding regulatory protein